ncbi:hypothetical protein BKA61DRAFT_704642 [Leptodontidium sp. MPI-SDFR-AT-0119]|nr:hypothetical protein BKA61DRAFT_704642 [Leptodontidium sp. MPI-SDFR-AT-0119]
MALDVNSVMSLMEGLRIDDKASKVDTPGHSSSSLQDSIQSLDQSAKITSSQAQQARVLADSTIHRNSLDITEIYSLCRIVSEVTERCGATWGGQGGVNVRDRSLLQRMLSHFDEQIRSIVQGVLSNSGYSNCVLWKIAEECYNQATSYSSALHPDNYFVKRDETCLEWPYDPDFEAEEYYEHEDRLEIDDDYAKAMGERMERRREGRKREEQSWIDFWVLVLHRCPNGPTLFYPPGSYEVKLQMFATTDIPLYLFRTFDRKSSGRSDDNVVASMASVTESPEESREDLLSLPKDEAIDMLHTHLTKRCCGGEESDNLMSWTSSLLGHQSMRSRYQEISAGQFAPDLWLLQAYRNTAAQKGGKTEEFFRFRLEDTRYHNGEYLPQGSVDHAGRSCVVSLESLEESGLYDLYPEFAEVEGAERWTNRVRELREGWSIEQRTTIREVQLASAVARRCFSAFETPHMMLILLAFKARKIKGDLRDDNRYCPEWARRPDELRRYVSAAGILKSRSQSMNGWGDAFLPLLNIGIVEEMFD